MKDKFCNLHTHTHASVGDSVIKVPDLVKAVEGYGQDYVAVTDHGTTASWSELNNECKNSTVNALFGNEFYCKPTMAKPTDRTRYHLVCIAMNETGLQNINKMQSIACRPENRYYKPLLAHPTLFNHFEGIFVSTACSLSYISQMLWNGQDEIAYDFLNQLLNTFGVDNVAIELQFHPTYVNDDGDYVQNYLNEKLIEMYESTDCKYIINTFDSHAIYDKDRINRKNLQSIAWKKSPDEISDTLKSNVLGNTELTYQFAYESGVDDDTLIQKCIDNTHKIAEKCCFKRKEYDRIIPDFVEHRHFKQIFCKQIY